MKTPVSLHSDAPFFDRLRLAGCGVLVRPCLFSSVIFLVASCCRPDPVEPSAKPPAERAGAFDPNSAENTLAWAAEVVLDDEDRAGDDPAARADARAASRHAIKSVEGKDVRWLMRVHQVTAVDCWVAPVCVSRPARPGAKGMRSFTLTTGLPSPDGVGFFSTAANFPTAPPKAVWLRDAKKGDLVVLVGRVVEAHVTGEELLVAIDGHVEMP